MIVNILGTEYTIEKVKISECDDLRDNKFCGICKYLEKKIYIGDASEEEYFGKLSDESQNKSMNETMRHEIIHAYFNESGLRSSSGNVDRWSENEEMVDWIAIQFPKILATFKEMGCI